VTSADAVCNRCFTARDALECLRQVDAPTVNKVNVNSGFLGTCFFVPVVDGTLITKRATELLRPGRVNGVSVFLVFPKSTSWISVNRNSFGTVTIPQYIKSLFPELSHDQITTGITHYADLGTPIEQARSIMSECE